MNTLKAEVCDEIAYREVNREIPKKLFLVGGIGAHERQWDTFIKDLGLSIEHEVVCPKKRASIWDINEDLRRKVNPYAFNGGTPIVIAHSAGSLALEGLDLACNVVVINPSYPSTLGPPKSASRTFRWKYVVPLLTGSMVEIDQKDRDFLSDGTSNIIFGRECPIIPFQVGRVKNTPLERFNKVLSVIAEDDKVIPPDDALDIIAHHKIGYNTKFVSTGGHFCHLNPRSRPDVCKIIRSWIEERYPLAL